MHLKSSTVFLVLPLLLGVTCAPEYEDVPAKMVGVGYNPEEIGPAPTPYGGVVEYSWVNFAGGGLSLALMGLGSYDEVGPQFATFTPPYAAVLGFSYIFDQRIEGADVFSIIASIPPDVDDTCYTTFHAAGPLGSFTTVDVGSWMQFATDPGDDGEWTGGFTVERAARDYPTDPQDLFIYYLSFDYWSSQLVYGYELDDEGDLQRAIVRRDNFPFAQEVSFSFPGGFADADVPVASLPRPSASVGDARFTLPARPGGVRMSWDGVKYDNYGFLVSDGPQQVCLAYSPTDLADSAKACDAADYPGSLPTSGQMYTGPWDADDGRVRFEWTPDPGEAGDYVSFAVRFLGPVDRDDPAYAERVVLVDAPNSVGRAWQEAQNGMSPTVSASVPEPPAGRRAAAPCEEAGEWVFDDAYELANGELAPWMQGDPYNNVAEVNCRLGDDGEFELTSEMVEEAMTYARRYGAEGAVFYFARSNDVEAEVPLVKDQYDQGREISPIKITSRAIDIGRFWYSEGAQ